jgi:hypothetical protein
MSETGRDDNVGVEGFEPSTRRSEPILMTVLDLVPPKGR